MTQVLTVVSMTIQLSNGSRIIYAPKTGLVQMFGQHTDGTLHGLVDFHVEQFIDILGKIVKDKSASV